MIFPVRRVERDAARRFRTRTVSLPARRPFEFCRSRLGSQVERCYSTLYDLTAEKAGVPEGFDLVFVGDVLVHTLYPLKALASLAALCRGTLVLAQMLPEGPQDPPAMMYTGGADPEEDEVSWWLPNRSCLMQMHVKLGFVAGGANGRPSRIGAAR